MGFTPPPPFCSPRVRRRLAGEGTERGLGMVAYTRPAPAVLLRPSTADWWRTPSLPHVVPAPLLLLCSGLRTTHGLYKITRSSTARIHLVLLRRC